MPESSGFGRARANAETGRAERFGGGLSANVILFPGLDPVEAARETLFDLCRLDRIRSCGEPLGQ